MCVSLFAQNPLRWRRRSKFLASFGFSEPDLDHFKFTSTILVKQGDIHVHRRQISGTSPSHEYASPAPTRAEDASPSNLQNNSIVSPNECRDGSIKESRTKQQGLEHPPVASVEAIHDEPADIDLADGQFLVERLPGKRVRRVRRHKVVQYLVKRKGYTEEENTWENELDIHEGLIKEYKSRSVSAP